MVGCGRDGGTWMPGRQRMRLPRRAVVCLEDGPVICVEGSIFRTENLSTRKTDPCHMEGTEYKIQ